MNNRRDNISFDPRYFEKQKQRGEELDIDSTFREIYRKNHWGGDESVSGPGSGSGQTTVLKHELPGLINEHGIKSMLDLPCGDFSWMKEIDLDLEQYIGADIVAELIEHNRKQFGGGNRSFEVMDLTSDPLPGVDLILCRDCLVHFSFADIAKTIRNLKKSSITWLLTTTFTECERNEDIQTGDWRLINLELSPFNFPTPIRLINEQCSEGGGQFSDKSLALWKLEMIE